MKYSRLFSLLPMLCLMMLATTQISAQDSTSTAGPDYVQFSGRVVYDDRGEPTSFPYVNVYVKGSSRGTSTDLSGFFSLVAARGETVVFSYVGYQTAEYTIPEDLESNWYTMIQTMTEDTIFLPQTVIYPWPSREFFEIEFLAMQPDQDLQNAAERNLSPEILALLDEQTLPDGDESADLMLREQAKSYYYNGQVRPQRIFDAMAWKEFIQAWKRGDFKKKKKSKK